MAVATAIWVLLVEVFSFSAGGYVAGRLRRRLPEATEAEVDMRDAWHGLLVSALGTLIGAGLAVTVVSGAARGGLDAGASAATMATSASAKLSDPAGYVADKLLRANTFAAEADPRVLHSEVVRILGAGAVRSEVSSDDKAYLAQLVAARSGLPQADAEKKVNDVLTQADAAPRTAADRARTKHSSRLSDCRSAAR